MINYNIKNRIKDFLGDRYNLLLLLLLCIGFLVRLLYLGEYPSGLHQDEAFSGYESHSMLHHGTDSFGYTNPVYLTVWGSGMSVLQAVVSIPFFALLGTGVFSLRLGQALLSCASLVVFYLLLREISADKKLALLGLFALTISPWHIIAARWALDANYAIYFLLFGLFFFIKGIKNNRLWPISAVLYGLALYSYVMTYVVIPLTLCVFGLYLIYTKTKFCIRYIVGAGAILFIFALPLILFMLVNWNLIPPIITDIISIPKLVSARLGEITTHNIFNASTWSRIFSILLNSYDRYALFYRFATPFIIVGFSHCFWRFVLSIKHRRFDYRGLLLLGFLSGVLFAATITDINTYKMNAVHIYTALFLAYGLHLVLTKVKFKVVTLAIIAIFLLLFADFSRYYVTVYNDTMSVHHKDGVIEAVHYTKAQGFEEVYVDNSILYPHILFADETPPEEYRDTVVYENYPSTFLVVNSFSNYVFGIDYNALTEEAYIAHVAEGEIFRQSGYEVEQFGNHIVAHKNG